MTVENTNSKSGPYDLDGSTLRFPRKFFLERPEHLQVFQVIDGVATLLTTGFTVTGIGSDEGEVIFSAEGYPVGGGVLMLKRNVPNTQETDYSNQARVKPEQVEIDLDKIVRQIQDLREVVDRSLHISIDQDLSDADLDRMSRAVIALGEIRDELEALYGKIPELQAVYDDLDEVTLAGRNIEAIKAFSGSVLSLVDKSFVATGGQTAFQLDVMAFAPENVIVWLNKIRLVPDLDYTTDGSTLILSAGASAGDVVDTLTISAVSMEDVKRIRDEALDAANKIKEAAVMQQTTFLIEDGERIYQLYKDGRPVSVWEYGVRLFIAPYGPLVERQDYHILPDGRIELHHDFDPGSLGIADFMVRYTDSEIQQIILGTKENADRAEAAAADAVNNAPFVVKDAEEFLGKAELVSGARYLPKSSGYDVSDTGPGDFEQAGKFVKIVNAGPTIDARLFGVTGDGITDDTAAMERALAYMKEAGRGARLELYIPGTPKISESIDFSGTFSVRMDKNLGGFVVPDTVVEAVTIGKASIFSGRLTNVGASGPTYDAGRNNYGLVLYHATGLETYGLDFRFFKYPMHLAPRAGERVGYSIFTNTSLVGGLSNITSNLTGGGWANELTFIGGRLVTFPHTEHNVRIEDGVNHIRFVFVSAEGSGVSAFHIDGKGAASAHSVVIDQCRTEGTWSEGAVVLGELTSTCEVRAWNFYSSVVDRGVRNRIVTPRGESFSTLEGGSALRISRTGSVTEDNALLELADTYSSAGAPKGIRYITARATGWLVKLGSTSKDILSVSLPSVTQGFLEFFGSSRFVRDSSARTSGALLIEDQFSSSGDVNVIEVKTGRNVGKVLSGSLISTGQVSGAINLVNNSFQFESRSGAWQSPPLKLGSYQLWVDAGGLLRIKNGTPTSDTDGTVVGTQA